ncbi:MAG: ribosome rescue protein RqcH [Thermoplasmatota archaeon]
MKDEMESIEIAAAVKEWKELKGGFLQKVYQPNKDSLLFRIHLPGVGKKMLFFEVGKALFLTEKDIDNPMRPGDYIMLMRKYVGNTRIADIRQHEMDRVVLMELEGKRNFTLIFEIFGKGNLVLTSEGDIVLPYRSESWKHRELKEGIEYRFPPSRKNPFELDKNEIKGSLKDSDSDLVRTLAVKLNLGGKYAEEVCKRADLDKNIDDFVEEYKKISDTISELKDDLFVDENSPRLIIKEDETIDATPIPLQIYDETDGVESKPTDSFNRALDMAFELESEEVIRERSGGKLERKLKSQEMALENMIEKEEECMVKAELIYQNYQIVEDIIDSILDARREENRVEAMDKIEDRDRVVQLNDQDEYVVIDLSGEVDGEEKELNVKINFRDDVNENAQHYYNLNKKIRKKIEGAERAIENTKGEIKEREERDKKTAAEEQKKKKPTTRFWFDRYKWFISSEGNLVIAGKDTKTNEEVVKKYLEKIDKYAHADAGGAPSVVIRNKREGEGGISKTTLKESCQYAVLHSKEWKRGIASGRAYWVEPAQVSKTAEAGESLPTGAFVIRGKRNYIDDLPLEASLVEITYRDKKKVMCAPSYALEGREDDIVKKRVDFIPGKKSMNVFAKEMSDHFNVPVEEIQNVLPPGDVNIVNKG